VALAAQDWQTRVAYELGLPLPGGPAPADPVTGQALQALSNYLPTLWEMAQPLVPPIPAQGSVYLVYLYTKLFGCDVLLGALRNKTDSMLGRALRVSGSQRFKQLEQIRKDTMEQIKSWISLLSGTRLPAFGLLVHKAPQVVWEKAPTPGPGQPVPPPAWLPDPNSPVFTHSPPLPLWPPVFLGPLAPPGT
jgi:hypothetical protein